MTQRTPTERDDLAPCDRAALELAIEIERRRSSADRKQIDDMLRKESRFRVATFAAHHCQELALGLRPWECWPPCAVEVDDIDEPGLEHRGIRKSAALLKRMLSLGISRWHPDPLRAIEEAKAGRTT